MRNLTESTRSREAAHPPNEMTRIWGWVLSRRGVGLGLSLVKAVVQAHQDQFDASPNPAGGSVFALYLLLSHAA
jgi:signal transduction histidine kinase